MSVVSCKERTESNDGTFREVKQGNLIVVEREYERVFVVTTDDMDDGSVVVKNASGLPKRGDLYAFGNEADTGARVVDVNATRTGNPLVWEAVVAYSSRSDFDPTTDQEEPTAQDILAEKPTLSIRSRNRRVVVEKGRFIENDTADLDESAIVNSFLDPFDPPVEDDEADFLMEIGRNEAIDAGQPATAVAYTNAKNSDFYFGLGPRCWKIVEVNLEVVEQPLQEGNFAYLRVDYTLAARLKKWDLELLDHGTHHYTSGTTTGKVPFTDDEGNPRTGNLDGWGDELAAGEEEFFRKYATGAELEFSALALPESLSDVKPKRVT